MAKVCAKLPVASALRRNFTRSTSSSPLAGGLASKPNDSVMKSAKRHRMRVLRVARHQIGLHGGWREFQHLHRRIPQLVAQRLSVAVQRGFGGRIGWRRGQRHEGKPRGDVDHGGGAVGAQMRQQGGGQRMGASRLVVIVGSAVPSGVANTSSATMIPALLISTFSAGKRAVRSAAMVGKAAVSLTSSARFAGRGWRRRLHPAGPDGALR